MIIISIIFLCPAAGMFSVFLLCLDSELVSIVYCAGFLADSANNSVKKSLQYIIYFALVGAFNGVLCADHMRTSSYFTLLRERWI